MRDILSIFAGIFFIWYLSTMTAPEDYNTYFNKHLNETFLYNDSLKTDTLYLKQVSMKQLIFDTIIFSIDSIKYRQDENTFVFKRNNKQIKLIAYAKKRKRFPI